MNKNGMTLIELLAVILILSIIMMICVPAFNKIKTSLLEDSLRDKLDEAKNAALEYADANINDVPGIVAKTISDCTNNGDYNYSDTDCANACYTIKIGYLIEIGYLVGDSSSKGVYTNPLTKKSLNNVLICVRYDVNDISTRKLNAFVID